MRIGGIGFLVSFLGATLGFSGFYFGLRAISWFGFVITGIGVAAGFIGVIYLWVCDTKESAKQHEKELEKLKPKQPWQ